MSRKHRILTFLLDNDKPNEVRLQVANEIKHRFECDKHYSIIEPIIRNLEDHGVVPTLDHFIDEYDYTYFTQLAKDVPNKEDVYDLIDADFNEYVENRLIQTTNFYLDKDRDDINTQEMFQDIRGIVDRYDDKIDLRKLDDIRELYEKNKNQRAGLKTHIEPIDDLASSFKFGTMSTLGGESGQFKTTLALNMMYQNLMDGYNVVFLSIEMAREMILYMLLSKHTYHDKFMKQLPNPIPTDKFRDAELTENEEEVVFSQVHDDLKHNDKYGNFEILRPKDFNGFTETSLRSRLSRLDFSVDGLIVDYIQDLKFEDHPFNPRSTDPINYYVRAFSKLTDDIDGTGKESHVMLLSQVNKEGYQYARQHQGHYTNEALSEANMIKRESTYIWFTYAPQELKEEGKTKVMLTKNRYGEESENPHRVSVEPSAMKAGGNIEDRADEVDLENCF